MINKSQLVFSTRTNPEVVKRLLADKKYVPGQFELGYFKDGEVAFKLSESVDKREAVVVGSTFAPAENLIKLVTVINTLKIRGAKSVTVIIPFMGYCKSDTQNKDGTPVNSRLFTKFIEEAGATRVVTLDLHSRKNAQYFSVPMTELTAVPLLAGRFLKIDAVATPDEGGIILAKRFAKEINKKNLVVISKTRPATEQAKVISVQGNPKGKKVVLVDDLIQTGGTLIAAAKKLKEMGATEINAAAVHMDWAAGGAEQIFKSKLFKRVIITDSVPRPENILLPKNFEVVPISDLIIKGLAT